MRGRSDRVFGPAGGAGGEVNSELTLYAGDSVETVPIESRNLHQVEFELFCQALESGGSPPYVFETGKQMLAITRAIHESIATGKVVPVADDF